MTPSHSNQRIKSATGWRPVRRRLARQLRLGLASIALAGLLPTAHLGTSWADEPKGKPDKKPAAEVIAPGWTLEQVEAAALRGNPTLPLRQAQVDAARGRWVQAGLMPNAAVGYSGQQVGDGGETTQHGVLMQMEFVRLRKLRLNRAIVTEEIGIAEQLFSAQELRVLTDARIGFYEVLTAQRRVELTEELVDINSKAVQAAERLLNAKEVSRVDVLQARIEADQSRILLANSRQRFRAAWRGLAATIGEPQMEPHGLVGDLGGFRETYTWEESLDRLLGSSPEISVAVLNIDRARQVLARARAENAPNLTVQGIIQHDNAVRRSDGAIQASMPIPVWNRNQGAIRAAEREVVVAEHNLRRAELSLQTRLAPVFERYSVARQQAERYAQDILPKAQESLDLAQAAYRAGELGYISLLTAQRTFAHTNLSYLDSLRDLWSASLEIEGLLLTGSLDDPK